MQGRFNVSTRRAWLRRGAFGIASLGRAQGGKTVFAYVGCFTTAERHGRGDGIHVYRMDQESGAWTHLQLVDGLVNPSFLALARDRHFLYSSHADESYVTSFTVDRSTGRLARLNRGNTGGVNGAHLALHPGGGFLVVANYGSGTVAVLPVRADGTVADQVQLVTLEGPHGPNPTEQAGSHPHQIVFDPSGRFVIVPDKGLDRVFVFRFDAEVGRLHPAETAFVTAKPGAGPRHAAFHPSLPVLWVLNELDSTTTTYKWDRRNGGLEQVQVVSSLPPDFRRHGGAAEIAVAPDGRFVYCSNRGHDSIVIYEADPKTGLLRAVDWVPTQGKSPRFFAFDPSHRFLFAANEQGDTVVTFRADHATGRLTPTGQVIRNTTPVTITFAAGS